MLEYKFLWAQIFKYTEPLLEMLKITSAHINWNLTFPNERTHETELGKHTYRVCLRPRPRIFFVKPSLKVSDTECSFIRSSPLLHGPRMKMIINHPFGTCQAQLLTLSFSEQKDFALDAFQMHVSSALIHCGNKTVLLRLMFLRLRLSASVPNVRALLITRVPANREDNVRER